MFFKKKETKGVGVGKIVEEGTERYESVMAEGIEDRVTIEENTKVFLEDFRMLVKSEKYHAIRKIIKFIADSIQGELFTKCSYNSNNFGGYIQEIIGSFFKDENLLEESQIEVNIAEYPVISCIWNHSRVISSLMRIGTINGNSFDGEKYAWNIDAYLIKPLNLVLVINGNHSVNAAIIYSEGTIKVKHILDLHNSLEKYKFNGKDYIYRESGKRVCQCLKNGSEPYTYSLGLLFEIARILEEEKISL